MTRDEALQSVVRFAAGAVRTAPLEQQLTVYQALSILCPKDARDAAAQIHLQLESVQDAQLKFLALLATRHDGPNISGDGDGGAK